MYSIDSHEGLVSCILFPVDFENCFIKSNTFQLEWPPKSGRIQDFPEVDKAGWFNLEEAAAKLNEAQGKLLEELKHRVG